MIENGWHPKAKCGNRNVPHDAEIIGSIVSMSGEVVDTFYQKNGKIFVVGCWCWERPQLASRDELDFITRISKKIP